MKIKTLISCAGTGQVIYGFIFAKAKIRFSRDKGHMFVLRSYFMTKHDSPELLAEIQFTAHQVTGQSARIN